MSNVVEEVTELYHEAMILRVSNDTLRKDLAAAGDRNVVLIGKCDALRAVVDGLRDSQATLRDEVNHVRSFYDSVPDCSECDALTEEQEAHMQTLQTLATVQEDKALFQTRLHAIKDALK